MAFRFEVGVVAALWALSATGCIASDAGRREVHSATEHRLGFEPRGKGLSDRGPEEPLLLLAQPLTAETAARIALMKSPRAALALSRLDEGRARAMGLRRLPNPHAELAARFDGAGESATLDLGATLDLTDLILLGYHIPAGDAELEAAQADAVQELLTLAHAAKRAFYVQQANLQLAALERKVYAAADAAVATARAMHEAGNGTELDLARQEAAASESSLRVTDALATAKLGDHALRQALGLWQGQNVKVEPSLPGLPETEPRWVDAEKKAIASNLEVSAAAQRKLAAAEELDGAWVRGVLPSVAAGVTAEREDDRWSIGPLVELEVPLFYQGQAERAGAAAKLTRYDAERRSAAIAVRAEIRGVLERLRSSRERVQRYATQLLPQRREILKQSLLQYNAMALGVFQLLDAQRALNVSEIAHVTALRDYWLARTDLAQLLAGARLGTAAVPSGAVSEGRATFTADGH